MRKIRFIWCGSIWDGIVASQTPGVHGLVTIITVTKPMNTVFTIHGKCELGHCGPFIVISLSPLNDML